MTEHNPENLAKAIEYLKASIETHVFTTGRVAISFRGKVRETILAQRKDSIPGESYQLLYPEEIYALHDCSTDAEIHALMDEIIGRIREYGY